MSLETLISEVISPITEAKFTIVRKEFPQNVENFLEWADDVLARANSDKSINISIDCEGYCLGSVRNSLSCIQLGEIFNDSYNVKNNPTPPDIGTLPGYIVLTPFSNDIKSKLTEVLNHPNVMLFTFDFIGDFSTIIESGINLEMDNVFDTQLCTKDRPSSYISCKSAGLAGVVRKASKMDPLAQKAIKTQNKDKKNYFKVSSYLQKNCKNPANNILTKDLLEMAADDIYFTGLAAAFCIKKGFTETVISKTIEKVDEFKKLVNSMNSILAPPIQRHLFFMKNLTFEDEIALNSETEDDLIGLLDVFQKLFYIINGYSILHDKFECLVSYERAKEVYLQVIRVLDSNRPRLNEMLIKYA